jgi:hypothetical protein
MIGGVEFEDLDEVKNHFFAVKSSGAAVPENHIHANKHTSYERQHELGSRDYSRLYDET